MRVAEAGSQQLEDHVDSLIVVLNDKLFEVMGDDAEMDKCFQCADDVLNNAVAGIAEIINVDGLVNVDFEDVKTVMGEQGKAMMGTATVAGVDRARLAAEQAVASPLLEGVDLSGARGVLVNITSSRSLRLSETREVMNTIKSYAAEDATVIFGAVYDDAMGDALRVTVVATGLGRAAKKQASRPDDAAAHRHRQPADLARAAASRQLRAAAIASDGLRRARHAGGVAFVARNGGFARAGAAGKGRRYVRHSGVPAQAGGLKSAQHAFCCAGVVRRTARAKQNAEPDGSSSLGRLSKAASFTGRRAVASRPPRNGCEFV